MSSLTGKGTLKQSAEPEAIIINETSFETGNDEDAYTMASWQADGFDPAWVQNFGIQLDTAHIDTAQAYSGNSSLRIDYPEDGYLPTGGGAQAPLDFTPRAEVYVSYRVRFSANFDWGRTTPGGKLPGLAHGTAASGGTAANGTNGFTARLMWFENGRATLYLYHMDYTGSYGDVINLVTSGSQVYFQPGQWHTIIQRVKINTGNNNDGEIQMWVDGDEAVSLDTVRFVNNGDLVDSVYFSTFHGGDNIGWAPEVDCYCWFDDLQIYYY